MNLEGTLLENFGWVSAIVLALGFPLLSYPILKDWGSSFFFGWIPLNVFACFYLGLSVGFIDAFFLFIVIELTQFAFIHMIEGIIKKWILINKASKEIA